MSRAKIDWSLLMTDPEQRFSIASLPEAPEIRAGEKLFSQECSFLKGVVAMDGLPVGDRLEICFAGRSNVGKSSLINALTHRRNLARSSNTPGRTQEINFFSLAETRFLVDLPGYGFAKAPIAVVEKWQRLMKAYLSGRANLRRVFLLIDARHGPKNADIEIMNLLDSCAVTFQVVLTKVDKNSERGSREIIAATKREMTNHAAAYPEIVVTSSEKKLGLDSLRAIIAGII